MAAIKESSKKLEGSEKPETDKSRLKLLLIRSVFVGFWLFFSSIIFVVAILTDINWMRPKLEETISHSIHRNVKLGHLSWHVGLRGLSVQTSQLAIAEANGDPFLMAGNCEIGFSPWPLLAGISQIDHVDMENTLFMAIRTGKQNWNFDDLLVASPDIDSIECHKGHVFVVNRYTKKDAPGFADTELNNVEIKLRRGGRLTPAQVALSFNLSEPAPGSIPGSLVPPLPSSAANMPMISKSHFSFKGDMWGDNPYWWQKNCHFLLDCQGFSWQNWQTAYAVFAASKQSTPSPNIAANKIWQQYIDKHLDSWTESASLNGRFDLNANAEGVPCETLNIELKTVTNGLTYSQSHKKTIDLPEIISSAKLQLETDSIKLNKFNINIPAYKMILNGDALCQDGSNNKTPRTQATMIGLLGDLDKLNGLASLKDLNGKLFFDMHYANSDQEHKYAVELKATDLKISGLNTLISAATQPSKNNAPTANIFTNPFTEKYWRDLGLSDQAKFTGTVMIDSVQGLAFKDCLLEDNELTWKLSGETDDKGVWNELIVSNDDLQLAKFSKQLEHNSFYSGQFRTILGVSPTCKFTLDGKAKVTLVMSKAKDDKGHNTSCEITFENAGLSLSNPAFNIRNINGTYASTPDKLSLKDIHCSTATGIIDLNATVPTNNHDPLNYHLHASKINPVDLTAFLNLFHLDTKYLKSWQLNGTLKEIDLLIAGHSNKPEITVTAVPDDLIFVLPSLKQPIHATSGKIAYANDTLSLEKVGLAGQNSNCFMTMVIRNLSGTSVVEKCSLVTSEADLVSLRPYFNSAETPAYFKNICSAIGKKYQINNLTGKLSGIIEYSTAKDIQDLHGSVDLENVALLCGEKKLAFHGINGTVSIGGNDLVLHDISGNIDDTSISVEGKLVSYQETAPLWNGEITAQVTPNHLNDAVSLLIPDTAQKLAVKIQAKKPINIKLKSHTHNSAEFNSIALQAEPDAALSISTSNLNIHQPAGKKLAITGNYFKDEQKMGWRNLSFDFGGNSILFQSMTRRSGASRTISKRGPSSRIRNESGQGGIDFLVQLPDYIPATLLAQVFPDSIIDGATSGGIKGHLSLQGTQNAPQLSGKILMSDLSLPNLYLNHTLGELSIPAQVQSGNRPTLSSSLKLRQFDLGQCQLSQGNGTLIWEGDPTGSIFSIFSNSPSSALESRFSLNDFTAKIADGTFSADSKINLKKNTTNLNLSIKGADLAQLWPQITNSQISVTGLLDCHFNLLSSGTTSAEIEKNMAGSADMHIGRGSFSRTGLLNAKLNQVNLLHQGIFGFNVNNLLQSVVPAKQSSFNSIDGAFGLDDEVLTIRRLLYDGPDLKFSAAGKANLALHSLEMDIAGVMPHVSTSVIGGPLGELSREITVQKLLDSLTLHKLDRLPSLPLIGGISNKSDIFTCKIQAPYNQPKLISQSINKSFRWLNYKPSVSSKHATAN